MRKAIKNYADPTAAATASDAVTYTVNKNADKEAASTYELKADDVKGIKIDFEKKNDAPKSKKALYIAIAAVAVVVAIVIIRGNKPKTN